MRHDGDGAVEWGGREIGLRHQCDFRTFWKMPERRFLSYLGHHLYCVLLSLGADLLEREADCRLKEAGASLWLAAESLAVLGRSGGLRRTETLKGRCLRSNGLESWG